MTHRAAAANPQAYERRPCIRSSVGPRSSRRTRSACDRAPVFARIRLRCVRLVLTVVPSSSRSRRWIGLRAGARRRRLPGRQPVEPAKHRLEPGGHAVWVGMNTMAAGRRLESNETASRSGATMSAKGPPAGGRETCTKPPAFRRASRRHAGVVDQAAKRVGVRRRHRRRAAGERPEPVARCGSSSSAAAFANTMTPVASSTRTP